MEDYDEGPGTPVKMGHYTVNDTFNFKEDKGVRMEDLNYRRQELITCPHCQHKFKDSWEYCDDENEVQLDCESCSKQFLLYVEWEIFYTTRKKATA